MNSWSTEKRGGRGGLVEGNQPSRHGAHDGRGPHDRGKVAPRPRRGLRALSTTNVRNLQVAAGSQCDEIWAFCCGKEAQEERVGEETRRGRKWGDIWTWTALDADSR